MKNFVFLLTILLAGCVSDNKEPPPGLRNIRIGLDDVREVPMRHFFSHVDFVPLEFTERSMIGIIEMLVYHSGRIYVSNHLDASGSNGLMIFDEDGKFQDYKLSASDGPGGFAGVKDFIVTSRGELEVLDRLRRRLIRYDEKGRFVENISIKANVVSLEKFDNGSYVFHRGNSFAFDDLLKLPNNIIFMDEKGDIGEQSFVPILGVFRDREIVAGEFFFKVPGKSAFYLSDVLNDTIYYVDKQAAQPFLTVELPDALYKEKQLNGIRKSVGRQRPEDATYELLSLLNDEKVIKKIQLILDTGPDLLLSFQYDARRYFAKVDKKNLDVALFRLKDPLVDNWFVFPYGNDRVVIVVNDPFRLKEKAIENPGILNELTPTMRSYIESIHDDVNPFLLVVDPKEVFD
jgi:6-bladed beta-propeller